VYLIIAQPHIQQGQYEAPEHKEDANLSQIFYIQMTRIQLARAAINANARLSFWARKSLNLCEIHSNKRCWHLWCWKFNIRLCPE